jgi:hypothetical protein
VHVYVYDLALTHFQQKGLQTMIQNINIPSDKDDKKSNDYYYYLQKKRTLKLYVWLYLLYNMYHKKKMKQKRI